MGKRLLICTNCLGSIMVVKSQANETQNFSNQLFYRAYFALVLCIIIIGSLLDFFINQTDSDAYIKDVIKSHQPVFALIQNSLDQQEHKLWHSEIDRLSQLTQLNISLLNLKNFASNEELMQQLATGITLSLYDENDTISLYQQINNTAYIIEIDTTEHKMTNFSWIPILFYSLIALVIFLLIQPFAKQLMCLKAAAIKIGKGDFATRLTMPKNSTLFPIADAFDTMTQEIENLMLRQRDLTNAVSHELRTPLARLKFAFEALEIHSQDHKWIENINEMRLDVTELENLIDEMLLYAQANQIEEIEEKNIRIIELVNDLVQSVHEKTIEITINHDKNINIETIILGDEHSLFRALSNILRNSISFAEKQCHINVSINAKSLTINIIDDGPGINADIIERIFEPFIKIDNIKRKSGYGLGLAIAKSIISKHNGQITVSNNLNKGACFSVSFPFITGACPN